MKKTLFLVVLSGVLLTFSSGCSESSNDDSKCENGTVECVDAHNSRKCVDSKWVETPCDTGLECSATSHVCEPISETRCTAGSVECVSDSREKRCKDGGWAEKDCESGESCGTNGCAAETTETCTDGAVECVSDSREKRCKDGEWVENNCDADQSCGTNGCAVISPEPEKVLKTGSLADVGKRCDVNDFTGNCEDNLMIFCNSSGHIESSDTCNMWLEYSYVDMRCTVINGIAGCVYYDEEGVPDTCDTPSDTITCNKDGNVAYHAGCGLASDGNMYHMSLYDFGEICAMACKDGEGCVEIPEKERCDIASFKGKCEDNSIVSCINGRLVSTSCGDQTCHEFAATGTAQCTTAPCDSLGDSISCSTKLTPDGDDYMSYADSFVCARAEDNKFYKYQTDSTYCSSDCLPDIGCIYPVKGEGDECNETTYEEKCLEVNGHSVSLSCISGFVEAIYCGKGKTCLNEMDSPTLVSGCYDDTSICQKDSDNYKVCNGSGTYFSTMTYECRKMSDNKYHYTPNTDTLVSCSQGCNSTGTDCK